jgi:hypothetical protein
MRWTIVNVARIVVMIRMAGLTYRSMTNATVASNAHGRNLLNFKKRFESTFCLA